MPYEEARQNLVSWVRRQLIGPATEENYLSMSPLDRYPMGVLHPVVPDPSRINLEQEEAVPVLLEDQEELETEDDETESREPARTVRRRRFAPPSSVGFSFYLQGEDKRLSITANASTYKKHDRNPEKSQPDYERSCLQKHTLIRSLPSPEASEMIWGGRAEIDINARPHLDGLIVTVSLSNRMSAGPRNTRIDLIEKSLFEARIECSIESGELIEYPRIDASLLDEEEQELELQYKKKRIYAIGHGAAVDWEVHLGNLDKPRIWSDFMPTAEVPVVTVNTGGENSVLEIESLAYKPMYEDLERFVDGYSDWIDGQQRVAIDPKTLSAGERATAKRICDRMVTASERMRRCVETLRTDRLASESFQLANQAMLDQMRQADLIEGKKIELGCYRWRPFQLAFLLTVMVSVIHEDDDYRDVLDLIWFPTGGGKTEAYLGLVAFLIVWRRLKYGDSGGGTVAFMRYTLRLLTKQQFERASRMICALELIRRKNPDKLGKKPFDIGIWVGRKVSPNTFSQARDIVDEIKVDKSDARHKLLLESCPHCGTQFDAMRGYHATERSFQFRCVNNKCEFGKDGGSLPCNVLDEFLYEHPPSLLIATVDKFARLAWEERAGAFFGVGTNFRPPELIIQDELHLITGPLGSVAGVYEAGFDTLLSCRGARPKYVASTATTCMTREQVRRLYARNLEVFPPPGLSYDDSYFARVDEEHPGRLYIGYLSPFIGQQRCLVPLAATLLAGPCVVFDGAGDQENFLEAWWTQVIYHGSLKSVRDSHNALVTEVRDFGQLLVNKLQTGRFQNLRIAQITGMQTAEENAGTFQRLEKPRGDADCLDAVLATNMVSVGLDVRRLALMVVNGQPLTTAEYIQATSRVGRAEVPGLIFANYYRHQARSLSHYESFRPYHESFYRFVEPSSVTPYTYQVRSRALHAALVITLRHACEDLHHNTSAGEFDQNSPTIRAVVEKFKERCERAASKTGQGSETVAHIERLVVQWHDKAQRCKENRRQLEYQTSDDDRNSDRLLYTHGDTHTGLWPTMHSMRNVENKGMLKVHD